MITFTCDYCKKEYTVWTGTFTADDPCANCDIEGEKAYKETLKKIKDENK